MKRVISKSVFALYPGGQLLQDEYFRSIRERVFNKDRYLRKDDSDRPLKSIIESLGLGSNDRGHNPGAGMGLGRDPNESKDRSLSSGYNDGETADDETGPGFTRVTPDPYAGMKFNELFLDLDLKGQGHNESIRGHLQKLIDGPSVVLPHKRHPVR